MPWLWANAAQASRSTRAFVGLAGVSTKMTDKRPDAPEVFTARSMSSALAQAEARNGTGVTPNPGSTCFRRWSVPPYRGVLYNTMSPGRT